MTIDTKQTKAIFETFFGLGSANDLTFNDQDKQKAIALFRELVEKSCQMSLVQGVFRTAMSLNPTLLGLASNILASRYHNCNMVIKEGRYYISVRDTIALKQKSAFAIRKQTGEWGDSGSVNE